MRLGDEKPVQDKLVDLKEFIDQRQKIRAELKKIGLPKKGERTEPAIRDLLRTAASKIVSDFEGREYVYAAALALAGIKLRSNHTPSAHPELWALSAILGDRRDRFFNENYLKREANALRCAHVSNIAADRLLEFLASKRQKIERSSNGRKKKGKPKRNAG